MLAQSRLLTGRTCKPAALLVARRWLSAAPDAREAYLTRSSDVPGLAFLNLNRPASKNAISMNFMADIRASLDEVRYDGTRALILQSTNPSVFCAGADLKERRSMSDADIAKFLATLRRTLGELETLPFATIAALDGVALGGGLEIALACDFRVASATATKLGLPETRLAVIPGAGGTQRMTRLIGSSKTKELIFTSRIFDATEALRLGVINHLAPEGQSATERAIELAKEIVPNGPRAIAAVKRAVDVGASIDMESGLDLEWLCYTTIIPTKDRLEGLQAFKEKRKPVYKGE